MVLENTLGQYCISDSVITKMRHFSTEIQTVTDLHMWYTIHDTSTTEPQCYTVVASLLFPPVSTTIRLVDTAFCHWQSWKSIPRRKILN